MLIKSHVVVLVICMTLSSCSFVDSPGPNPKRVASVNNICEDAKNSGFRFHLIKCLRDVQKCNAVSSNLEELKYVPQHFRYQQIITARDQLTVTVTDPNQASPFATGSTSVGTGKVFGPLEVSDEGLIKIPYLKELIVTGKTLPELTKEVSREVQKISARADVFVTRNTRFLNRVSVFGEVGNPGTFEIDREGFTLLQAIALSGGAQNNSDLFEYALHRDGKCYRLNLKCLSSTPAKHEDVIHVTQDRDRAFHVIGLVREPGRFAFTSKNTTLMDALSVSGGLESGDSNARLILIFRRGRDVFGLNFVKSQGPLLAQEFSLESGDVVYVAESVSVKWDRITQAVLPWMGAFSSARTF